MLNQYPDRFLSAPTRCARPARAVLRGLRHVGAGLEQLTPEASLKVRKGNYERIFDEGRGVSAPWERPTDSSAIRQGA
jgi:hypothetical protein